VRGPAAAGWAGPHGLRHPSTAALIARADAGFEKTGKTLAATLISGIRNALSSAITTGGLMKTGKRGFASMDRDRQREIASKGGKLAHLRGMAHEWTPEEAREAGRKGGAAVRQRKPPPGSDRQDQE
jgi:general stress protein YciG